MARILTGNKMIDSVRKRTMCPDDTSIYTDEDILDILDEEMQVQVLDKLVRLRGDNITHVVDIAKNDSGRYVIPTRALGDKLRDASLLKGSEEYELSQIDIGELPDYSGYTRDFNENGVFYMQSNEVVLVSPTRSYDFVRMRYHLRPNFLTKVERAGIISSIVQDTDANTLTLSLSQVGSTFTENEIYDIVGKNTPNKIKAMDLVPSSLTTGDTGIIVFDLDEIGDYLNEIIVGDYVTLAGETPVPNIPTEMHPLLAQAAAVQVLEGLGDTEALQNAVARFDKMVNAVQTLIDARVELAPKKIKPRHGALRSQLGANRRKGRY